MRERRKKKADDHIDETWLLPYSDLLTLLVALFIVLFAMSSVDNDKFQSLSHAFNEELKGGTGLLEYPSPLPEGSLESSDKNSEKRPEQTSGQYEEQQKLGVIQNRVNAYIAENGLQNSLETSLTNEGLSVTIRDNILFDSGSADIRQENLTTAKEISNLLVMDVPRNIIVSGHTDNVPIKNAHYRSNWELSVMRAINFMRLLLENERLNPELFSANGHGEFDPIASNDTAAGRAQNRRVEILIQPITTDSNNTENNQTEVRN
ncbi:flagellar motor protein MotB [Bacillus benzoevorans]|uniref:Chemotaxis protein MotB n=1 Tax=Bacillus benzoevorans TaxID=1456 RepID=A0A7X0HV33_9BACI|nr:flagellar motor protein MotB [Bacillus benzoevorans]MBB6447348.1 chemotaxis protein MotB [Bacillus benzoevorans]